MSAKLSAWPSPLPCSLFLAAQLDCEAYATLTSHADNAAKLYGVLRHTAWAEHAKFVLVRCAETADLEALLWPPFSKSVAAAAAAAALALKASQPTLNLLCLLLLPQVTAEGHAAPGMNYDVLQPLTWQRVETWADFSARLPSQQVGSRAGSCECACSPVGRLGSC